jgi:4'-phosphopantetheinyl transferase
LARDPGKPADLTWWSAGLCDVPANDEWVDTVEAERFSRMRYTKRRNEARMARYTAKSAVARFLGRPHDPAALRAVTVRNAADGAPEVAVDGHTADLVIAMTDRADWAVAAVAGGTDRIGCDLELVERRSEAFVADYFTAHEQQVTNSSPQPELTANLIWSAKESALKVLRTGLRRDTRTVEVTLGGDTVLGWNPLSITTAEGAALPGWWVRFGEFVLTMASAVPTTVPRSLEEPPPLASGHPGHSWLDNPRPPTAS